MNETATTAEIAIADAGSAQYPFGAGGAGRGRGRSRGRGAAREGGRGPSDGRTGGRGGRGRNSFYAGPDQALAQGQGLGQGQAMSMGAAAVAGEASSSSSASSAYSYVNNSSVGAEGAAEGGFHPHFPGRFSHDGYKGYQGRGRFGRGYGGRGVGPSGTGGAPGGGGGFNPFYSGPAPGPDSKPPFAATGSAGGAVGPLNNSNKTWVRAASIDTPLASGR